MSKDDDDFLDGCAEDFSEAETVKDEDIDYVALFATAGKNTTAKAKEWKELFNGS